jgi:heptosyltransferase-2
MRRTLPARLLVDLPSWVGDQVIALPAVWRLVEANTGGETVLHTRPTLRRFLALVFPETQVLASVHRSSPLTSARHLCRKRDRFDVAVTLRNSTRAKILMRIAARWTLGSCGEAAGLLLSRRCAVDRRLHQIFDADSILDALGLPGVDPSWRPRLPSSLADEGTRILEGVGLAAQPVVGLAPATARGETKRWPAESYGGLARKLERKGIRTLVVIGPGEESTADRVRAAAEFDVRVAGSDLDVAGLAGLVSRLDAMVCNDSGPMHLAATFGTPVVTLFGPSDPKRTAPLGDHHEVLCHHLGCAPCATPHCSLTHRDCLRGLSVAHRSASAGLLVEPSRLIFGLRAELQATARPDTESNENCCPRVGDDGQHDEGDRHPGRQAAKPEGS